MFKYLTIFLSYTIGHFLVLGNVRNTLIESTILIHTKGLNNTSFIDSHNYRERRLLQSEKKSIEAEISKITPPIESDYGLTNALTTTFNSFPDDNLMESVLYATNYIFDNHKSLRISETGLLIFAYNRDNSCLSTSFAFLNSSANFL